jgi:hypothetical protein
MLNLAPVSLPESVHKFIHKLILRLLRQRDTNEFELRGVILLPRILSKSAITRETNVVIFAGEFVKSSIIQPLKFQRHYRFDLVAFRLEGSEQFARQIFVEQDSHAGSTSRSLASSCNAPRMASPVRLGYSSTIWGTVMPAASDSKTRATEMRVSRMRGAPQRWSGSDTIQ